MPALVTVMVVLVADAAQATPLPANTHRRVNTNERLACQRNRFFNSECIPTQETIQVA